MALLAVAQTNAGSFRLIVMGKMDSSPSLLIAFAGAGFTGAGFELPGFAGADFADAAFGVGFAPEGFAFVSLAFADSFVPFAFVMDFSDPTRKTSVLWL